MSGGGASPHPRHLQTTEGAVDALVARWVAPPATPLAGQWFCPCGRRCASLTTLAAHQLDHEAA